MRDPLPAAEHPSLIVVGAGSPFGDDQAGWHVAAELTIRLPALRRHILVRDRPGAALLNDLAGSDSALLIDAAATGDPPGTIRELDIRELTEADHLWSGHALGVAETLVLGQALGLLPERVGLLVIGIDTSQAVLPGAPLTPRVAAAVSDLTEHLAGWLSTAF